MLDRRSLAACTDWNLTSTVLKVDEQTFEEMPDRLLVQWMLLIAPLTRPSPDSQRLAAMFDHAFLPP